MLQPPQDEPGKPGGGLYLIVAMAVLLVGWTQFSPPGQVWPTYLAAVGFAGWGYWRAHENPGLKRSAALAVCLVALGWYLWDLAYVLR
jgi:hypothetical protein